MRIRLGSVEISVKYPGGLKRYHVNYTLIKRNTPLGLKGRRIIATDN